ncbi:MAG: hypothetical protein ACOCYE_11320, partial [Pseudomonadota bacterium]
EAVHTVQQQGGTARARRTNGDTDPERRWPATGSSRNGWLELTADGTGGTLHIPSLAIPTLLGGPKGAIDHPNPGARGVPARPEQAIHAAGNGSFSFQQPTPRGESARGQWLTALGSQLAPHLSGVRNWGASGNAVQRGGEPVHYLRLRNDRSSVHSSLLIVGTAGELANDESLKVPHWTQSGNFVDMSMQIDHLHELQLGGCDGFENFWVLAATPNASSGATIMHEVRRKISAVLDAAEADGFWQRAGASKPEVNSVRWNSKWRAEFESLTGRRIRMQTTNAYWTRPQIETGMHLRKLVELSADDLGREGFVLGAGETPQFVSIFASPSGGFRRRFDLRSDPPRSVSRDVSNFFGGFELTEVRAPDTTTAPAITALTGEAFKTRRRQRRRDLDPVPITLLVQASPNFGYGGYIDPNSLNSAIQAVAGNFSPLSPVRFVDGGISPSGELYANGEITATKALFPDLVVPIRLRGNEVFIDFPIPTERLNFGPVSITEAALSLGIGEQGLLVEGFANFAVDQVGEGSVSARMEEGGAMLRGVFDVDLDFLETARAEAVYDFGADTLTISLTAGVGEDALPGVTGGEVTVTISREAVAVSGNLQLAPPLEGAQIRVDYAPESGLALAAEDIPLPVERLPGVENATLTVRAVRNPDDGTWTVSGSGTATFAAAGATGRLDIAYEGGVVTANGRADVARGPASGWLQITATNQQLDDEGNPVEDGQPGDLVVFGSGEATIAFGDFLEGTAGLEYTRDGRTIITGTIRVQPRPLFDERVYEKELLRLRPPEFPIWGVSVAGIGVGIFAFVDAYVRFEARVGPGELQDTHVTATIDLDRPQEATVEGNARFYVPAYTGLTLDLGGGLRARLAVAYVQGRVGLEGELGIEADASAAVNVQWNPTAGFALRTEVDANARPKFRVGVNASVSAGVDVLVGRIEKTWGPWQRTLGEFGPDMELGVTFPVTWSEQNGLDLSLDNMTVRRPQLDAAGIMGDAFDRLV